MSHKDISGSTIGKLYIAEKLEPEQRYGRTVGYYLCKCECGKYVRKLAVQLRRDKLPSCPECAPKKGRPKKLNNY